MREDKLPLFPVAWFVVTYEDDLGDVISPELNRLSSVALTDMMILVTGRIWS